MDFWALALVLFAARDTVPRIEVRGVEVTGAWLGLAARSLVAVFLRGPDGIRLVSPDTATAWAPLDSGSAAIAFDPLPAAATDPVNCIVTDRELYRWDLRVRARVPLTTPICGPMPPSTTGPGRAIPGRPGQQPGDAWYIPRPNDAADRVRYLIVIAVDGDAPARPPAAALDDRVRAMPALMAAQVLGERLARGTPGWAAVVVPLGR